MPFDFADICSIGSLRLTFVGCSYPPHAALCPHFDSSTGTCLVPETPTVIRLSRLVKNRREARIDQRHPAVTLFACSTKSVSSDMETALQRSTRMTLNLGFLRFPIHSHGTLQVPANNPSNAKELFERRFLLLTDQNPYFADVASFTPLLYRLSGPVG